MEKRECIRKENKPESRDGCKCCIGEKLSKSTCSSLCHCEDYIKNKKLSNKISKTELLKETKTITTKQTDTQTLENDQPSIRHKRFDFCIQKSTPECSDKSQKKQKKIHFKDYSNNIQEQETSDRFEYTNNYQDYNCNEYLRRNSASSTSMNNKKCEKTTYCRTSRNYLNELKAKTLQKEQRLQVLVKQLIEARKKEKEEEDWRNYVEQMYMNRTQFNNVHCITESPRNALNINNDRKPEFRIRNTYNTESLRRFGKYQQYASGTRPSTSYSVHGCYPYSYHYQPVQVTDSTSRNNRIQEHAYPIRSSCEYINRTLKLTSESGNQTVTSSPEYKTINDKEYSKKYQGNHYDDTLDDNYNRVMSKFENMRSRLSDSQTKRSLAVIESKVDNLMKSINSFIEEIRTKKEDTKIIKVDKSALTCNITVTNNKFVNTVQCNRFTDKEIICCLSTLGDQMKTPAIFSSTKPQPYQKKKDLLEEEIENNLVTRDVDNVGNDLNRKRNILEIPTRDTCTEVTKSLSRTVINIAGPKLNDEGIYSSETDTTRGCFDNSKTRRTLTNVAINTDPLSVLALMRVSAEAVKKFLSYVPYINNYSYLPQLNQPATPHYVCNICGAAFQRPTALSDHIHSHIMMKQKECCVCRHYFGEKRRHDRELFKCRYCGQKFTRAYCCEIHQSMCAERQGRIHDASSSLIILR